MDYWKECIESAFEEHGIQATDEQIESIAGDVEVSHENYGMAHGHDAIGGRPEFDKDREIERLKRQVADLEASRNAFHEAIARRENVEPGRIYVDHDGPLTRVKIER